MAFQKLKSVKFNRQDLKNTFEWFNEKTVKNIRNSTVWKVQWFGHMRKTKRVLKELLRYVETKCPTA